MERLQEFSFVQAGMVVATVSFFWMGAGFPVGAMKGSRAGRRVLRSGVAVLLAGTAVVLVWGVVSGQLSGFSEALGFWELIEMAAFVAMFEFIVYLMADRYLVDKAEEEERQRAKEVETKDA